MREKKAQCERETLDAFVSGLRCQRLAMESLNAECDSDISDACAFLALAERALTAFAIKQKRAQSAGSERKV